MKTQQAQSPSKMQQYITLDHLACHSQNKSKSKQQYSFPKASRFNCKTQMSEYNYYDLPTTKTKVSAIMSKQKRQLFSHHGDPAPAPDRYNYNIEGEFSSVKKRPKGYYMALGRSEIKINNFLGRPSDSPDPLKYCNPQSQSTNYKKEFSFTRQKKFLALSKKDEFFAGPGSYNIDTSLDQRKQILSSQFRSLCPKIQDVKIEKRKQKSTIQPSLYCPMITTKGQQLKFNRNKGAAIGRSRRSNIQKHQQTPGPGQYKLFSQFFSKKE